MTTPDSHAASERARLQSLRATNLLDSAPEEAFDRFTRLATRVLGAPTSLVSLIDADRQFFKSTTGLREPWASRRETPLSHSFCQYVVADREMLAVEDAREHPVLKDNLAIDDIGVIAYAGSPLITSDDQALGSLCVIYPEPHTWTERELAILKDLAEGVVSEIELRRMAVELHERERTLSTIIDSTSALIWLLSPDGTVLRANETALQLIGAHTGDYDGMLFHETDWWRASSALRTHIHEAVRHAAAGEPSRLEAEHLDSLGRTLTVEFSILPVLDDSGVVTGLVAESHDVTDRKRVERLKAEIVAIVSHEIRTPLGASRSAVQLLARGRDGMTATDRQLLDMIVRNTERLLALVNELLDLERLEAGAMPLEMETASVSSIVGDAFRIVSPLADDAGVTLHNACGALRVTADGERVTQVLVNLLANALRFSPRGESVTVSATAAGAFVEVAVADNGRGIAANQLHRVFDRFAQAHLDGGPKQGSGLGLSISRAIVEQHGGHIRVESEVGAGTTFCFTLPAA